MSKPAAPLKRKESIKSSKQEAHTSNKKQKLEGGRTKTPKPKSKPAAVPVQDTSDGESDDDFLDGITGEKSGALRALSDTSSDAGDDEPELSPAQPKEDRPVKTGTTSAEAHAAQRVRAKERKANKPNADTILRLNKISERLRRQSHVPLEERKQLVSELFEIVTGNIRDLVFKHDSVRVIQVGLKYANSTQRLQIAQELKDDYLLLAESKYGKFLVAKLIVEGDKEIRGIVIPSFYGHVRRLINHPEAAWILDDIYRQVANTEQRALLLREWYSAEYAVHAKTQKASGLTLDQEKPTADLKDILEKSPEKRRTILQYLHQLINQLIQKKQTAFTMLHDAMLQYILNVGEGTSEHTEFFELLKTDLDDDTTKATTSAEGASPGGDLLKSLAFTQSGARVVRLAFAYGTAKDRKVILRVYRDLMVMMAEDQYAHTVLLAASDVIDDTKLTTKAIWAELLGDGSKEAAPETIILENLVGKHARVVMLYPFAGLAKSLFPGEERAKMDEIHAVRTTSSKKDPETRRQEIIKYISPTLLKTLSNAESLETLVRTTFGPQAVTEIMLEGHGDKAAACQAIATLCSGPITAASDTDASHIALSPAGGKMLKSLVQAGKYDPEAKKVIPVDPPLGFADVLYEAISKHLMDWATGPSCSVIAALLESTETSADVKKAIRKTLGKNKKQLEAVAASAATGGAGDKKGKKGKGDAKVVNAGGLRLLLELLDSK